MAESPWNEARGAAWQAFTKGRRKYLFYPLFAAFVLLGLLSTFVSDLGTVLGFFRSGCASESNAYSPGERDVVNEWVLIVGTFPSQAEAEDDRSRFVAAMFRDKLRPSLPPNANEEKIFVVRDPRECGRWLEILDFVPGDGSREMQLFVRDSLGRLGPVDPGSEMSRWIRNSRPFYYSREDFERRYGKVEEDSTVASVRNSGGTNLIGSEPG